MGCVRTMDITSSHPCFPAGPALHHARNALTRHLIAPCVLLHSFDQEVVNVYPVAPHVTTVFPLRQHV